MTPEFEDIVRYRLDRAEAALKAAHLIFHAGDALHSTNRLYYACFYAVIAWMQVVRKDSSKHTGVRSVVNRDLVSMGRLLPEDGDLYNRLFTRRQEADYTDFAKVMDEDVQDWLPQVRTFIDRMKSIIEEDGEISL